MATIRIDIIVSKGSDPNEIRRAFQFVNEAFQNLDGVQISYDDDNSISDMIAANTANLATAFATLVDHEGRLIAGGL